MFLAAAALSMSIDLTDLVARYVPTGSKPTCGIKVVSHRFSGPKGTSLRYAGVAYIVPASGWIEILAEKGINSFEIDGHSRPLNASALDEFGTDTVLLR
jgi:hypothetical protein